MTREELERMMSYHAAEASFTYLKENFPTPRKLETGDITDAFVDGAEWARKYLINKACEWLKSNLGNPKEVHPVLVNHLIENFRKAMEE